MPATSSWTGLRTTLHRESDYPVLSQVAPGSVRGAFEQTPPKDGRAFASIFEEFEQKLVPGLTHWNQPDFLRLLRHRGERARHSRRFSVFGPKPAGHAVADVAVRDRARGGELGLAAPVDWPACRSSAASSTTPRPCPRCTPWRRPASFTCRRFGRWASPGVPPCHDTESTARNRRTRRSTRRSSCSVSVIRPSSRSRPTRQFRMKPESLERRHRDDRAAGRHPLAVVATVGTTSSTSVDPVPAIADICEREGAVAARRCLVRGRRRHGARAGNGRWRAQTAPTPSS